MDPKERRKADVLVAADVLDGHGRRGIADLVKELVRREILPKGARLTWPQPTQEYTINFEAMESRARERLARDLERAEHVRVDVPRAQMRIVPVSPASPPWGWTQAEIDSARFLSEFPSGEGGDSGGSE